MYVPFSPFTSLGLAPAPNNPLSVLKCLLGTLFSKHKSPGRILVEQVSRKPVAQAGDSSPMDEDTSLGGEGARERKRKGPFCSSQPCPPTLLSRLY